MGSALITGATSGIGKEMAWQLATEGNDLVLVARNEAALKAEAERIENFLGVHVEVLPADLALQEGTLAVAERLRSTERPIGLLVNNAGFGLGQEFIGGSLDRELEALNVMVRAVMVTCHAAAEVMVERGYGAIINIASIASLTAQGSYSAHKAWVRTFTEGLASDLAGTGVTATVVCPGLTATEFHTRAHVDSSQWNRHLFASAEQVAAESIAAARRGQVIVTPTLLWRSAAAGLRVLPRSLVRKLFGPEISGRTAGIPKQNAGAGEAAGAASAVDSASAAGEER